MHALIAMMTRGNPRGRGRGGFPFTRGRGRGGPPRGGFDRSQQGDRTNAADGSKTADE